MLRPKAAWGLRPLSGHRLSGDVRVQGPPDLQVHENFASALLEIRSICAQRLDNAITNPLGDEARTTVVVAEFIDQRLVGDTNQHQPQFSLSRRAEPGHVHSAQQPPHRLGS